ncbi:MAG: hypothetical protein IJD04_01765 [Desulfovibrionaceae bacterium]|nr:hypothetical protein [Desulfovibrionaceae bacterium]
MNKTLKLGIVLLGIGCAGFTWLLMYMSAYHPAALFGMLSQHGYTFSFRSAPPWLWGGMIIALLMVVKGATSIGRGISRRDE